MTYKIPHSTNINDTFVEVSYYVSRSYGNSITCLSPHMNFFIIKDRCEIEKTEIIKFSSVSTFFLHLTTR